MHDYRLLLALFLGLAVGGLLLRRLRGKRRHLPPGPKPLPLVGNSHQMPTRELHRQFAQWNNMYGDLVKVEVPGGMLYVVRSREIMMELFEGRSSIYSSRPRFTMSEIAGWGDSIPLLPYGPRFRACRRLLKQGLSAGPVRTYYPYLERAVALFLEDMQMRPQAFVKHYTTTTARVSLKIAYGYAEDQAMLESAVHATEIFSKTAVPGMWLVDIIPLLKYVPSWFPMAGFKRYATHCRGMVKVANDDPYNEVKKRLVSGTSGGSFTARMLQAEKLDPMMEECIKWSAFGIFAGQFDTTSATLSWFTLAMVKYPEVQAKGQAELDRVIGSDRLPSLADRASLPYINAIMQEVFRWHPIVPMVTHTATKDDEYRGYFVPAGTTVVGNVWAVFHDETVYRDPESFIPERFTEEGAPDSMDTTFGFGRRVCPGILIAQAQVFLTIASMLATMNITKAKDEAGNIIEPVERVIPGLVSFPEKFQCTIQPRSEAASKLIRRSAEHARSQPDVLEFYAD